MSSFAASSWQTQLYKRISSNLKLPDFEEIRLLRLKAEMLRNLRKKLLAEKYD